jgi:hypothetical protein
MAAKSTFFWNMTPYNLVQRHQCCGKPSVSIFRTKGTVILLIQNCYTLVSYFQVHSLFAGVRFHNVAKSENPQITDRPPKTMYSFRFLSCGMARSLVQVVETFWCPYPLKGPIHVFSFLGRSREYQTAKCKGWMSGKIHVCFSDYLGVGLTTHSHLSPRLLTYASTPLDLHGLFYGKLSICFTFPLYVTIR